MSINVIQWNINGLVKKLNDIKLINQQHDPIIICLQETNLNNTFTPSIKNFNVFSTNRTACNRASGGVAILVRTDYPSTLLQIQSPLEVVAISIQLESSITICNIYIPNQKLFKSSDIENIIQQLPPPFLLLGDFNSHGLSWGSDKTDDRGKQIEKVLETDNIILLNSGEPTRLNPSKGKFSAIDLSLCSSNLAQRTSWSTLPEIYDSDHIPIKIELLSSKATSPSSPNKWKIKNPNWNLFSQLVEAYVNTNPPPPNSPTENDVAHITNSITNAANISIGKTNGTLNKPKVPWWNPQIKLSIKEKNIALKRFQKTGKIEDHIRLKELRAKTKFLVKRSKASSWKNFTSTIGPKSNPSSVWSKIRSLRGNSKEKQTLILNDNILLTDPIEVANLLGNHFHSNSSDNNYNESFLNNYPTSRQHLLQLNYSPLNQDQHHLNTPISAKELNWALSKCSSLSPGPDEIPYSFLHNLPSSAIKFLLHLYNKIWNTGEIPKSWKHAIVIPILKPGKDKFSSEGYRPISLLNTMCKILEKIIDSRLRWFLEKTRYLSPQQNGFRKHRSTYNSLHEIQKDITKSLESNQVLGLVALDIAKAMTPHGAPG